MRHASNRSPLPAMVGRAGAAGFYAGGISGLIAGTAAFPVLGTGIGALVGIFVGSVIGVANGLVLAFVARWTHSRLAFGVAAASTSGLYAVLAAAAVNGGLQHVFVLGSGALAFVGWCVLLGAVLGPLEAPSRQPDLTPEPGWCAMAALYAARGALVATGCGAIAGFVVGLFAYPLTSPAALVEGAILAVGPGAVIGAIVGLARWEWTARALR